MGALNRYPEDSADCPVAAGVRAAAVLRDACRESLSRGGSLRVEVVRDLAADLERQLGALSGMMDGSDLATDPLVDAALACADLATLAVCNLPALPPGEARKATSAVHLAAGAARELCGRAEARAGQLQGRHVEYAMRDARGALWRAELAARQAGGLRGA